MFLDDPVYNRCQRFTSLGKHKALCLLRPVQLEAGGKRGDPHLARRRIGRDHKFARRIVEQDIEHAILFFDFKTALFLGVDEAFLEGVHRGIAVAAECSLI